MFGDTKLFSVVATIDWDPAADDVLPVWIASQACELRAAKVVIPNTVAASTANYFDLALLNGGAAGTATTQIAGTIGGTAGWTGLTPVAFTIAAAQKNLAAGDVVVLKYNEEGTGTFSQVNVQLDYVLGT